MAWVSGVEGSGLPLADTIREGLLCMAGKTLLLLPAGGNT